jgi:hypothetical protein
LELEPARHRQEPRHIRCLSQEYRMSPVDRPWYRRHLADLGTAAASVEEAAVASAEEVAVALAEAAASEWAVDSAAVMKALATDKRSSFRRYARPRPSWR